MITHPLPATAALAFALDRIFCVLFPRLVVSFEVSSKVENNSHTLEEPDTAQ